MYSGECLFCPEVILEAYKSGLFPMAESKDGDIYWHYPDPRAVFPIYELKQPRSVRQAIRKFNYSFTFDKNFESIIRGCARRDDTWISDEIIEAYLNLHNYGFAHSVETWSNGELAGGLYGVAIGAAFFGESMFSSKSDASKAAFYRLVDHLKEKNFILLDSQYLNEHTEKLGAIEIPAKLYRALLNKALSKPCSF